MSDQMSHGHRKSQEQTKKMYSLLARKKYFFCRDKVKKHYLILITIYGSFHLLFDTIGDPISEMEKRADGADASVLFFSLAVLIFLAVFALIR